MMSEKKKGLQKRQESGWATTLFFFAGSRYRKLYHDTGPGRCAVARHDTARRHHDTHGLAVGVSRDTNFVSWLGRPFVSQYGAARQRYGAVAPCNTVQEHCGMRGSVRDTTRGRVWVAIQFLYRDRRGRRHGSMRARHSLRHGLLHGRARPRHCASAHHDTTPNARRARGLGAVCA